MLHALLRNKTGRADLRATPFHAAALHRYEDPLTAAVFERLAYLPAELMLDLLTTAAGPPMHGRPFPAEPGPLLTLRFWPALFLAGARIEPDVLIAFDRAVLVVEAKHREAHHASQWKREVRAAREAAAAAVFDTPGSSSAPPVWLLAVGPSPSLEAARETVADAGAAGVLHFTWVALVRVLRDLRAHPQLPAHEARLVDDVLLALSACGYRPRTRFWTLPDYRPPVHARRALQTALPRWDPDAEGGPS